MDMEEDQMLLNLTTNNASESKLLDKNEEQHKVSFYNLYMWMSRSPNVIFLFCSMLILK